LLGDKKSSEKVFEGLKQNLLPGRAGNNFC